MSKKCLIALPGVMLEQIDWVAGQEHRTRSDLIREALRRYLDAFRRNQGAITLAAQFPAQELGAPPVGLNSACDVH